jgi:cysteine-rich repeat protein
VRLCGDGRRAAAEECDDGNAAEGDGCSASCRVEAGWACARGGSATPDAAGPDSCTLAAGGGGGRRGRGAAEAANGLPKWDADGCAAGAGGRRVCVAAAPCPSTVWSAGGDGPGGATRVCLAAAVHEPVWACATQRRGRGSGGVCGAALSAVEGAFGVAADAAQREAQRRRVCVAAGAGTARECVAAVVLHLAGLPQAGPDTPAGGGGSGGEAATGMGMYRGCSAGQTLSPAGRCVDEAAPRPGPPAAGRARRGSGWEAAAAAAALGRLACEWRLGPHYAWDDVQGCRCRGGGPPGPLGCPPDGSAAGAGRGNGTGAAGEAETGNGTGAADAVRGWEADDRACTAAGGTHYEADGAGGCWCRAGYTADASEDQRTCRPGTHRPGPSRGGGGVKLEEIGGCAWTLEQARLLLQARSGWGGEKAPCAAGG